MSSGFTVEQLLAIMKGVADNNLSAFTLKSGDVTLKISGCAPVECGSPAVFVNRLPDNAAQDAAVQEQPSRQEAAAQNTAKYVTSPIVGTFYAAAGPDSEAFVKVGQAIHKGDVIFIVESMKVMNEVPSEVEGIVAEILVENGQAVEYGQPVLRLE